MEDRRISRMRAAPPAAPWWMKMEISLPLPISGCRKTNRAKIRVKKWIDMPEAEKYDAYISRWHYFLKKLSRIVREDTEGILSRNLSMYVLKEFYLTPYDRNGDFYAQIEKRIGKAEAVFGISHS